MAKKQIIIEIAPDGSLKVNNTKNLGAEKAILDELAELAELLSGDPKAFVVEKHEAGHAHGHASTEHHVHA